MDRAYGFTIELIIALLAVVITVFVLAVSLLGQAVEKAREERREKERKWQRQLDGKIADAKRALDDTREKGVWKLVSHVISLCRLRRGRARLIRVTRRSYRLLSVEGCVLYPAGWFLAAFGLNLVSIVVSQGHTGSQATSILPLITWSGSLAALAVGAQRLWKTLHIIQAAALSVQVGIELEWNVELLPFEVENNVESELAFRLSLINANMTRNAEVWFFAPESFAFPYPKTPVWVQDADFEYPNYLTISLFAGTLKRSVEQPLALRIRTPSEKGTYTLCYRIRSEDYVGELTEFQLIVN